MSTVFQRKKGKHGKKEGVWYVGVPVRPEGWVKRSTGTTIRALAYAMARMLDELGPKGRRAWHLLDPLRTGTLSVGRLYDAFSAGPDALEALVQELKDVDVEPEVAVWLKSLRDNLVADTIQHYSVHVRSLIRVGERFPISGISRNSLAEWLRNLECTTSTKRKYRAAMSSFCDFLVQRGIIERNFMLEVRAPKAAPSRNSFIAREEEIQLVTAQAEPHRTISALMHGTGIEISAVLRLTVRDLDQKTWMIRAQGTKTKARDRQVYVPVWVRPYLLAHVAEKLPGDLVFPGVTRWAPTKSHNRACAVLGITNYTLRDSRHTFAVRATKAGIGAEYIAAQLGHSDTQMVNKVYSRFHPMRAEMSEVFERADLSDSDKGTEGHGSASGASAQTKSAPQQSGSAKSPCDNGFPDSRGGTRTRDPGIMSAVL